MVVPDFHFGPAESFQLHIGGEEPGAEDVCLGYAGSLIAVVGVLFVAPFS